MARRGGWWLTSTDRVLSELVPAPPADVREFYCELRNLTRLHPLIVSVQPTARDETAGAYTQDYRIRDRIPVGPLAIGITYTARVVVPLTGDVLTEARQFPRVRLSGAVSFTQVSGGTQLTERLAIQTPRLLGAVTARAAVAAHTEMLAGIRRLFSQPDDSGG